MIFPPLDKGGPGGVVTRASATVSPGVYVAKARGDRHNHSPPSLGIELDGNSHFEVGAREYDENRQRFIQPFGISILRFMNTEIYENLDGVLEMIGSEVLARRGETGKS